MTTFLGGVNMEQYKMVEEKLNELGISFQVVEHEPAVTIEIGRASCRERV